VVACAPIYGIQGVRDCNGGPLIDFCRIAVVWDIYKAIVVIRFTIIQESSVVYRVEYGLLSTLFTLQITANNRGFYLYHLIPSSRDTEIMSISVSNAPSRVSLPHELTINYHKQ
jgi:hypothetical protein